MRFGTLAFSLVAAVLSASAQSSEFGVTFSGYQVGERLSDKGASGGSWGGISSETVATNVILGTEKAMDINTFEADANLSFTSPGGVPADKSQYDFKLSFDFADRIDGRTVDAQACGFTVGKADDDSVQFAGAAGGTWHLLFAPGFSVELNRLYDLRLETCSIGGAAFVSYLVKTGGEYVRMADAAGKAWFRIPRETGDRFSTVEFAGEGRISDFSGGEGAVEPTPAYHWVGADGDWTKVGNWSLTKGGESCGAVPGAGDYVRVDGKVCLVNGEETATLTDFIGRLSDAKIQEVLAGSIATPVTFDTRHPRAGKKLSLTTGSFLGIGPDMVKSCTWWRGSTGRVYEPQAVSTTDSYTFKTDDYCHWFKVHAEVRGGDPVDSEFYFSKLPVFYMTTDDGQTPSAAKEEHDGQIAMQSGEDQWKDKNLFAGKMTIKVRGNSTKGYAKKPWKLKLDEKWGATVGGDYEMAKSKHWVLLANYNDKSNMRNKLSYDFANAIGSQGMKSTWVECVLNGSYQGCYQLCEHIRIDKNRVNVYDWEGAGEDAADAVAEKEGFAKADKKALETQMSEDFSWVTSGTVAYKDKTYRLGEYVEDFASVTNDITGGYLFESSHEYDEVTKFTVNSGSLVLKTMLNSPEFLNTNPKMTEWCSGFLQNYCDAITSADGYSKEAQHWSDYCDADSMAAYFLVMEMFGNNDASYKSRYFYKQRGEKMAFGPVWDFDWGVGNDIVLSSREATGWKVRGNEASFYREWADDPWFCTRLWTLYWKTARAALAAQIAPGGVMDQYKALLTEAGAADDAKWLNDSGWGSRPRRTFAEDVELLRTYLSDRLVWLDQQFASVSSLLASYKTSSSSSPYSPDTGRLPMAFDNAPTNCVYDGESLKLSFKVGSQNVGTVDVFANGLRVRQGLTLQDGYLKAEIPAAALTAEKGEANCVSLVAYDWENKLKARNYALVTVLELVTPQLPEGGGRIETTGEGASAVAVVMPEEGQAEVAVRLPKDYQGTVEVPVELTTVRGVPAEKLVVKVNGRVIPNAAFVGGGADGFSLALNPDVAADVTVQVGDERIPVKPVLSDATDDVKPLDVSDDVTVGVKSIPGLTYSLIRRTDLDAKSGDSVDLQTASGARIQLSDSSKVKPPRAFYTIEVSKDANSR